MVELLAQNIVLIFFAYGLAWFALGLVVAVVLRYAVPMPLTRSLPWLAAFGFSHGIADWADTLVIAPQLSSISASPYFSAVRTLLAAGSAVCLLMFAARLLPAVSKRSELVKYLPVVLVAVWLAAPVYAPAWLRPATDVAAISTPHDLDAAATAGQTIRASCSYCHSTLPRTAASVAPAGNMDPTALDVYARYVLYFPALAISGIALLAQGRAFRREQRRRVALPCALAGGALFGMAAFTGLVAQPAPFFPANTLNYHSFVMAFGLPPQLFRAVLAAATTILMVRVLAVYRGEWDKQVDRARQAQLRAEQELSSGLSEQVCELTGELSALHGLGEHLVRGAKLGPMLSGLAEVTAGLMRADGCTVHLVEAGFGEGLVTSYGTCSGPAPECVLPADSAMQIISERKPTILSSSSCASPTAQTADDHPGAILVVPLLGRDTVLGILSVHARPPRHFDANDVTLAQTIAAQAATAIENAYLYTRLNEQAIRDTLTGLYNRRYLLQRLDEELLRGAREGSPVALLFCDIDHFKDFNDRQGHLQGDRVLELVGETTSRVMRALDIAGRYGGDEFAIVMPGTPPGMALVAAERLRREVSASLGEVEDLPPLPLTLSIGIASFPDDAQSCLELIDRADWAMYSAKRRGGNQISVFAVDKEGLKSVTPLEGVSEDLYLSTVHALAAAVDARDRYTHRHSESVARISYSIATELGLPEDDLADIRVAGLLHDIGKIGVSDDILNKPGPLSEEEWVAMKKHPRLGADILKSLRTFVRVIDLVGHHHERWDGRGYPDGISYERIPLGARILAVADAFHAMTSERPYRPALSPDQALTEIRANAGVQFDPRVVEAFERIVSRKVLAGRSS